MFAFWLLEFCFSLILTNSSCSIPHVSQDVVFMQKDKELVGLYELGMSCLQLLPARNICFLFGFKNVLVSSLVELPHSSFCFYHILFVFYERQERGGFGWEGRWGESDSRGSKSCNQDILCEKNIFNQKNIKTNKTKTVNKWREFIDQIRYYCRIHYYEIMFCTQRDWTCTLNTHLWGHLRLLL